MSQERYRGILTEVAEQPLRLLIVSERGQNWLETIYTYSGSASQWELTAHTHVEAMHLGHESGPDVVVLELGTDLGAVRLLLDHAKLAWPHTVFIVFSQEEISEFQPLIAAYGDMPILHNPAPRELCERIEQEASALSYGLLRGLSLPSLLQMMQWERKSGAILVHSAATWGRLHLLRGELVEAYVHASEQTGEAAALEILSWDKTTLFLERSYHNQHQSIARSLPNLLMEAVLLQDEDVRSEGQMKRHHAEEFHPEMFDFEDAEEGETEIDSQTAARSRDDPEFPPSERPAAEAAPLSFPTLAGTTDEKRHKEIHPMENVKTILDSVMSGIDGAMAAALVDYSSGMALGTAGSGINLDVAAAGNTDVVRAKLRTMESLGIQGSIEDILITLDTQYHIIYLVPGKSLFMYLVLSKDRANLAMARYRLKSLTSDLQV